MTLAAKLTDKQKWQRLLSSLRYSLYVIFHPFDGFWDLSREKRGSLGAANIIVFLVLLVRLLSMQFTDCGWYAAHTGQPPYTLRSNPASVPPPAHG